MLLITVPETANMHIVKLKKSRHSAPSFRAI